MKSILIPVIFFTSSAFTPDIVRRHDKSDAEYLALGEKYAAVCKVGLQGGDGTLVAKEWVITAAHVARGMNERSNGKVEIYFAHRKEPYMADAIFIHPEYQMVEHDIALIRLKEPVENVTPLPLYNRKDEHGQNIIIVGHGYSKHGDATKWETDGRKRAATNVIDDVSGIHVMFDFDRPGEEGVTELEGTAGSGDSGGPALIERAGKEYIAGISSAGEPGKKGPGTYGATEYYTRVSTHIDWLQDVLSGKITSTKTARIPRESDAGQERVIVRRGQGAPSGMFRGLGLILDDKSNRIQIHGKVDQEVPAEFRSVLFGPPSYLVSFNGKKVNSIQSLRDQFDQVRSGETYQIEFSIKGQQKKFKAKK